MGRRCGLVARAGAPTSVPRYARAHFRTRRGRPPACHTAMRRPKSSTNTVCDSPSTISTSCSTSRSAIPRSSTTRASAAASCRVSRPSSPDEGSSSSTTDGDVARAARDLDAPGGAEPGAPRREPPPPSRDRGGRSSRRPAGLPRAPTHQPHHASTRSVHSLLPRHVHATREDDVLADGEAQEELRLLEGAGEALQRASLRGEARDTSSPARSTRPRSARRIPDTTPNRVLLPAPFGPTSPATVPACDLDAHVGERATRPPKRTVTSVAAGRKRARSGRGRRREAWRGARRGRAVRGGRRRDWRCGRRRSRTGPGSHVGGANGTGRPASATRRRGGGRRRWR